MDEIFDDSKQLWEAKKWALEVGDVAGFEPRRVVGIHGWPGSQANGLSVFLEMGRARI
jgi:hypothetical protein